MHIGYRRIRMRAILESLSLFRETRGLLDRVRQPLLIVHSRDDHVVPPRNADLIRDGVESVDIRVILLDNCYHVSTIDFDAPLVMDEVVRFVQRIASTGGALTHPIAR